MKRQLWIAVLTVPVLLLFLGMKRTGPAIPGKPWYFISLAGEQGKCDRSFKAVLTLDPKAQTFLLAALCSRAQGNYLIDEHKQLIRFTRSHSTSDSCDNLEFEISFFKQLMDVTRYRIEGHSLFLCNEQKKLIRLAAAAN